MELEQSKLHERDSLIYYRAEGERSRVFEHGLRIQKQQASELFDRYRVLYGQRDDVELALRTELQKAQQVIDDQRIELSTYREQQASAANQSPVYGPRDLGLANFQYPTESASPPPFQGQPGVSTYGAGLEQVTASYEPAPIPAGVEYPTSAVRDLPRPEMDGGNFAGRQSGSSTKKRRKDY